MDELAEDLKDQKFAELKNKLAFPPAAAQELDEVLTDPELGGCVPATEPKFPAPLLDPSVDEAQKAVESPRESAVGAPARREISLGGPESDDLSAGIFLGRSGFAKKF